VPDNKKIIEPIDAPFGAVVKSLVTVPNLANKVQENDAQWSLLPLIEHKVEKISIDQRANDGYINATAVCQASGKLLGHYLETKATKAFLDELSADIGIPITELVQIIKGGHPQMQGTWVHPQVAINLGQWASPKFAVLVSKWTFEWMTGSAKQAYQFPYHIRRYLINRSKIPATHFSMLDQMTFKLLGALESKGYVVPATLMPDISLGKIFSQWLRDKGHDPDTFLTYSHEFDDGKRPVVQARLYPNDLMTEFNQKLDQWITSGAALKYFSDRDPESVEPLKLVYADIKTLEDTKKIEG
jgi:hypothetical protein